jgi:hypothetical protein
VDDSHLDISSDILISVYSLYCYVLIINKAYFYGVWQQTERPVRIDGYFPFAILNKNASPQQLSTGGHYQYIDPVSIRNRSIQRIAINIIRIDTPGKSTTSAAIARPILR